jgi:hypothetical protein
MGTLAPAPTQPDVVRGTPSKYEPEPGIMSRIASGIGSGVKDYASGLAHGDMQNWAPLLAAISAAGTAPTVHPGVALAAGLGAGAQSYMGTKEKLSEIAKRQADIKKTQAETETQNVITNADISKMGSIPEGMVPVIDPTNTSQLVVNGKHYKFVPFTEASGPAGASTPSAAQRHYNYLDKTGAQTAAAGKSEYFTLPNDQKKASDEKIIDAHSKANAAHDNLTDINQWASALAANKTGPLQGGPLQGQAVALATTWNNMVNISPLPPEVKAKLLVEERGADQSVVAQKMAIAKAMGADAQVGQKSFSSLQQAMAATANGNMPRGAALQLAAQSLVKNQRDMDRGAYYDDYDNEIQANGGMSGHWNAQKAERAYQNAYTEARYASEQAKLQKWLDDGRYQRAKEILSSTATDADSVKARKLVREGLKQEGMLRYFTGATNG